MYRLLERCYDALVAGNYCRVGFVRFLRRLCANMLVYPLGLRGRGQCGGVLCEDGAQRVIVSLTSFPARIGQLWKVTGMLLRQHADVPLHTILWLSAEQFPHREGDLPRRLLRQRRKGLDIRFVDEDLKPHKKYYYSFLEYPRSVVITVDDDVLYPLTLVQGLLDTHRRYPHSICCNRGRLMPPAGSEREAGYATWRVLADTEQPCEDNAILPTGVGGVLYPPEAYDKRIFDREAIMQTCLRADDLWLNFMCRLHHSGIVHSPNRILYVNLFFSQKGSLYKSNVNRAYNDGVIAHISQWGEEHVGCDFFTGVSQEG